VETGEKPILLLGDVMSALDDRRCSRLLTLIRESTQTIISTNRSYFTPDYIKGVPLIDLANPTRGGRDEFVILEGEDA